MSPQLTTTENTITYHNFQFILGHSDQEKLKTMLMESFGGDKQRALWYVMVLFLWSIVSVNVCIS